MSVGPMKGKEVFVASPVCQKQRISFDQLCERMAEDSTVGQADVAAVFYKFRKILNQLCSQGYIVDGDPIATSRPHVLVESGNERGGFQAVGVYLQDTDCFHANAGLPPVEECRVLPCGEAGENESQTVRR